MVVDLEARILEALQPAFDAVEAGADPVLRPSSRAHYQANGAIALARRLGRPPQDIAEQLAAHVASQELFEHVEVSGGGFLNLWLTRDAILEALGGMAQADDLGASGDAPCRRAVVDYSHPNVAKEMHVGHLRSTIIGDAICRVLSFVGAEVVRENHIGDWGTPFGMLIEHLLDLGEKRGAEELSVGDLDSFYRQAREKFDSSESFRQRARLRVVALQSGDPETRRLWGVLVAESVKYFSEVYAKLGVLLEPSDVVGESFYNDQLPEMASELQAKGLLVESEGAQCVFPPGFSNREGEPLPLIVRKSDGGWTYAATDLAAIRDRVRRIGADLLIYVVGAPQAQHLAMCFKVAEMAGWLGELAQAVHVEFGSVLGPDGRMLRSRAGTPLKLSVLVDEAVARARQAVAAHSPSLSESERDEVARAVGVGALKYSDLSNDRRRDYIFDWDKMLALDGNTAPYLQYAHARLCSILSRADISSPEDIRVGPSMLEAEEELELALAICRFRSAIKAAVDTWAPHRLCSYLYDLAIKLTSFYEHCPVLAAPDPELRSSRLALCGLAARVLSTGLGLLGIEAPRRM